jgi:hypothetical protein
MAVWAAVAIVTILAGLTVFQVALAAGAPLGHFAWGGQHRTLSTGLRIGSIVSIVIYAGIAAVVLAKTGLWSWLPAEWAQILCWIVLAYLALGIPLNAISRSRPERIVMTPLVTVLVGLVLVVALGP